MNEYKERAEAAEAEAQELRRKLRVFSESIREAAGVEPALGRPPRLLKDFIRDLREERDQALKRVQNLSDALNETIGALEVRLPENDFNEKRLKRWGDTLYSGSGAVNQNEPYEFT